MAGAAERIQEMLRNFEEQAVKAGRLQSAVQDMRGTATSDDRSITVSVAPSGAVLDLAGENLAFIIGCPQKSGWFGAIVGNESHAPHGAGDDRGQPPWPQVNPQVAAGDYLADEWVHDPAVFGWAHAGDSQQSAPQSVAALNSGGHLAWLVCSDQRLAVVVEADALSEAESSGERPGLLGGWLGKGKANSGEVEPVETWWQLPGNGIAEFSAAALGRGFEPIEFFRINFTDRSTLEFRLKDAAELVEIAGQRI